MFMVNPSVTMRAALAEERRGRIPDEIARYLNVLESFAFTEEKRKEVEYEYLKTSM